MFIPKDMEEEGCEGKYRTSKSSWRSLGKTTENMEQNWRPPSRVSGFIPAKYEVAGLPTGGDVQSIQYGPVCVCNGKLDSCNNLRHT